MQLHRGRMIDHIQLRTQDLDAMKRFYKAVLETVGVPIVEGEHPGAGKYFYADELWVDVGEPASHIHLAFQAWDKETVDRFYEAALANGGRDNSAPGRAALPSRLLRRLRLRPRRQQHRGGVPRPRRPVGPERGDHLG